jgi:hypothetical protein
LEKRRRRRRKRRRRRRRRRRSDKAVMKTVYLQPTGKLIQPNLDFDAVFACCCCCCC